MWQTEYASAVPKNLGVGVNFGRAVKAISSLGVRSPCPVSCQKNQDHIKVELLGVDTFFHEQISFPGNF